MSYINPTQSYTSKDEGYPECFGDDAQFSEKSKHCRVCPFRIDCDKTILRSAMESGTPYNPAQKPKPKEVEKKVATVKQYGSSYRSSTYGRTTTRATQSSGSAMIRPVKYNHNKSLVSQYTTYVAFDVAEAATSRLTELIQSCRDEYEANVQEGD